jgi:hypothetical protein
MEKEHAIYQIKLKEHCPVRQKSLEDNLVNSKVFIINNDI